MNGSPNARPSLTLDVADRCLFRDGQRLPLSPKDFALLQYLVAHRPRVIPHTELLDAVWPDVYVAPDVLKVRIQRLRRLLGDDSQAPRFVRNVHGERYSFIGDVVIRRDADGDHQPSEGVRPRLVVARRDRFSTCGVAPANLVVGREVERAALERVPACGGRRGSADGLGLG
jgi:DNA-binding winged helix-turn-helix (wHTH) protein